jgi:uncharacterized membrane protein YdjX (TVP38/TMEM64 family)
MTAGRRRWFLLLAFAAAGVLLIAAGRQVAAVIPRFVQHVEGLGTTGALLFIAGYTVATVAFIPGSLLTLAAGAVFGIAKGTLLVFIGATIGETAAFLIARHVARDAVSRRVRRDPRFAAIDDAIAGQGRKIVLLLRLSPVFPFNLLNYALGLTRISLRDYIVASIGILPGTLLYVYSGKVAGDIAAIAAGVQTPRGTGYYIVLAVGLGATIAVTVMITKIARRALQKRGAVSEQP